MPPWYFQGVSDEQVQLTYSPGEWLVTDGAHLDASVALGFLTRRAGTLRIERDHEGIRQCIVLQYPGEQAPGFSETEIVIDSGYIVLCSRRAFVEAGVTNRTSSSVLRSSCTAEKQQGRCGVITISDASGECVGIVARPAFGDGVYALTHSESQGAHILRVELARSN